MNKFIFWDFDGTLTHSDSIWSNTTYNILKEYIDHADYQEVRMHLRKGYTWHKADETYTDTGMKWWDKLFLHFNQQYARYGIDETKYAEINTRIRDKIISPGNYTLYRDAMYTLHKCADLGVKNYILSNNYPELSDVVKALGLDEYIAGYIVSSQIGYEKPHPGIFEYALSLANVDTDNDRYIMVGDNPAADMKGGKNAGFQTIYVHAPEDGIPCEYADFYAGTLSEIPALLCIKGRC